MWSNSVKSIWSKIIASIAVNWKNTYVRWGIFSGVILILVLLFAWIFAPVKQTAAGTSTSTSNINVQNVTKQLPSPPSPAHAHAPTPEEALVDPSPNYFYGHSTIGAETEVKCQYIRGVLDCNPKTDLALENALNRLRVKQAVNVMRMTPPEPISMTLNQQIALEQALGTPYVIESDGTMTIFDGAFPKQSDFIKAKAIWQRNCIDKRGRTKRNRSCR